MLEAALEANMASCLEMGPRNSNLNQSLGLYPRQGLPKVEPSHLYPKGTQMFAWGCELVQREFHDNLGATAAAAESLSSFLTVPSPWSTACAMGFDFVQKQVPARIFASCLCSWHQCMGASINWETPKTQVSSEWATFSNSSNCSGSTGGPDKEIEHSILSKSKKLLSPKPTYLHFLGHGHHRWFTNLTFLKHLILLSSKSLPSLVYDP